MQPRGRARDRASKGHGFKPPFSLKVPLIKKKILSSLCISSFLLKGTVILFNHLGEQDDLFGTSFV